MSFITIHRASRIECSSVGYSKVTWEQIEPKLFTFPGGEPHCVLDPERFTGQIVWIEAHIGSMQDWGYLLVTIDALRQERPKRIGLYIPYFPGARQDHPEPGTPNTLGIYTHALLRRGLILTELDPIIVADPHSIATPMYLHAEVISAAEILAGTGGIGLGHYTAIICPDAGAEKRAIEVARALQLPVVMAHKVRDQKTGKLSGFRCEPIPTTGRYLIVDDICDGGGTFVGLAAAIRRQPLGATSILDLYVTHGIFSKGFAALSKTFERIITTDAFPTIISAEDLNYFNTSVLVLPLRHHAEQIMQRRLMT